MTLSSEALGTPAPIIPQPEPGLTPETVIARAEAMIPMLREQQDEAEAQGHFSDKVLQRFRQAGFYRMFLPRMFGGYEFDHLSYLEVVYRIAAGHPGSAWCFALSGSHVAVAASYLSEQAQRELIEPHGELRSPHRAPPSGRMTKVEGGYRVSGRWSFSSGVPVSTHFAGNSLYFPDEGEPPRNLMFFIPIEEVTVLDDWGGDNGLGMQGSGSNTVVIEDRFVPENHVIAEDMMFGTDLDWAQGSPGTRLHGNPHYLGIFGGFYHLCFAAIYAGAARAAVEELTEMAPRTKAQTKGAPMLAVYPHAVRALGQAAAMADASYAIMREAARMSDGLFERWARTGEPILPSETMRVWALGRQAALTGCQAVQLAFQNATPVASRRGHRLQRYLRDAQMYLVHPSSQPQIDEARGEAALGRGPSFFLS